MQEHTGRSIQTDKGINGKNMTTERVNVVRVWRDG